MTRARNDHSDITVSVKVYVRDVDDTRKCEEYLINAESVRGAIEYIYDLGVYIRIEDGTIMFYPPERILNIIAREAV